MHHSGSLQLIKHYLTTAVYHSINATVCEGHGLKGNITKTVWELGKLLFMNSVEFNRKPLSDLLRGSESFTCFVSEVFVWKLRGDEVETRLWATWHSAVLAGITSNAKI